MKAVFVCIALLFSLKINAQEFSLIGKWKILDKGESGFFILGADSSVKLIDGKDTIKSPSKEGQVMMSVFSVDTFYNPFHLDFILKDALTGEIVSIMKGIYRIISKDKLMVRFDTEEGARPKDFLPKGNEDTVTLNRVL